MTLLSTKLAGSDAPIHIAPSLKISAQIPRDAVPRYGIVQLMRRSDGSYETALIGWSQTARLNESLLRNLGIDVSYSTVRRLIRGGFIKGSQIAPETFIMDLQSFVEHLENTRDPEWWTPERKQKYRQSL